MGATNEPKNLGIRISQPFYDAETTDDKNLIFSSSFPTLKEEATGVYNINGLAHAGAFVPVFEHKLSYHPFFLVFDDEGKMRLGPEWQIDENNLYFSDNTPLTTPTAGTGNFRWVVYRLPLFTAFKSKVEVGDSVASGVYSPDYGIKVAKDGKDIDSTDLRDFTIHSKGRSPLVHEVSVKEWGPTEPLGNHEVTPDFAYNPIAFGFTINKNSNKAYNMQNGSQSPPKLNRSDKRIFINSLGANTLKTSIIVFKDPFLAPVTKDIIY